MKPLMAKAGTLAVLKLPLPKNKMNGADAQRTRLATKGKDNLEWTCAALKFPELLQT